MILVKSILSITGTPSNGSLPIGNGQGFTVNTLTAGTNITITNGPGTITIDASGGSGSPAGSTNEIQYNNAGAFGASSNLQWDITNSRAILGTETVADTNSRLVVIGKGQSTNTTFAVHNQLGNSNSLVVLDNGNVGIGTNNPVEKFDVVSDVPNARFSSSNGNLARIYFGNIANNCFINVKKSNFAPAVKFSIPLTANSVDSSCFDFDVNDSGFGSSLGGLILYPKNSDNAIVLTNAGNSGNTSRYFEFKVTSASSSGYRLQAFRFYSAYTTSANSNSIRFQINNVTQARAAANINISETWHLNSLVGITDNNTIAVDNSAVFDLQSSTRGFLPPRMTTTDINNIVTPATGLMVYNTTENTICFYNGTAWQKVNHSNL